MSYVAAGAMVVGVGMQVAGGEKAAGAARDAATAQNKAANDWSDYVRADKAKALSMVNTPSQIQAYETALNSQEANVKRQEQLVASIHPALIEAGKQMSDLLQGKSAPVLGQIQNQRSLQRQQMLEQLRTQLGPGAETSSAGQQAMQRFDQQTAGMMSDVQQQYLDKVSNISLQGGQSLGDALNHANATLTSIQQTSPGVQAADVMAKFDAAESGAQSAIVNSAGGQYAGAQIQGQEMSNIGNSAMTLGAMYAGRRGTTPTPASTGGPTAANASMAGPYANSNGSGFSANGPNPENASMGGPYANSNGSGFNSGNSLASNMSGPSPASRTAGAGIPAYDSMSAARTYANSGAPLSPSYGEGERGYRATPAPYQVPAGGFLPNKYGNTAGF